MSLPEIALQLTLRFEGGFTNHPNDPGKATRYGIIQKVARADGYLGEMKYFPLERAHKIYIKNYWKPSKAENITNQKIANYLFDTSVNCGIRTGSKLLQKAYNNISKVKLKVDGKIGRKSISAINKEKPKKLFNSFVTERIKYYDKIMKKNPKLKVFKLGWYRRAFSF